ncbi:MAG: hypothetical protein N2484_02240 [Clostridia bacterium]|nr:hypothetical protein [Clostridia bacterium]
MEKTGSVKKIVKLSDNDKRILLAYSSTILETPKVSTSKAALQKTF